MSEVRSRLLQNALAIVAALFVVGALLPWSLRLPCVFGAIGVLVLLALLRLQDHKRLAGDRRSVELYGRIERLRGDREARFKRPARRR